MEEGLLPYVVPLLFEYDATSEASATSTGSSAQGDVGPAHLGLGVEGANMQVCQGYFAIRVNGYVTSLPLHRFNIFILVYLNNKGADSSRHTSCTGDN